MHNQKIYSRFEYYIGGTSLTTINDELREMFDNVYEDGLIVSGASAAKNVSAQTVIILTYSEEADHFLRLKFYGRKDVKFHDCRPKKKEAENE